MGENLNNKVKDVKFYASNYPDAVGLFNGGGISVSATDFNSLTEMVNEAVKKNDEECVSKDVKTILTVNDDKDTIELSVYDDGKKKFTKTLIPDVNYIDVINDRVIIVYFCDGTIEKAVLAKNDTFSLENGLSICLTKKLLSEVSNGNGSSVYNKLIEYMIKAYEQQVEMERIEDEELKAFKEREEKKIAKAKAKREKRLNAIREEQIEIQKEAYIRAMRELNKPTPEEQA